MMGERRHRCGCRSPSLTSRAYFNAVIPEGEQPTFVKLLPEDPDHHNMCAQLLRHMYGTRGAAD